MMDVVYRSNHVKETRFKAGEGTLTIHHGDVGL